MTIDWQVIAQNDNDRLTNESEKNATSDQQVIDEMMTKVWTLIV